jgi:hypothetical protein
LFFLCRRQGLCRWFLFVLCVGHLLGLVIFLCCFFCVFVADGSGVLPRLLLELVEVMYVDVVLVQEQVGCIWLERMLSHILCELRFGWLCVVLFIGHLSGLVL